jgi:hypothetical protein
MGEQIQEETGSRLQIYNSTSCLHHVEPSFPCYVLVEVATLATRPCRERDWHPSALKVFRVPTARARIP